MNRSQLRHAHACHNTGRTNRARADTDFNGIRTGSHQIQSGFSSRDVAADDLDVRIGFFYPAHAIDNALAMTVGSIDHNYVHACLNQCFDALFGIAAGTHRSTDAQTAFGIFVGIREFGCFQNIFNCNQTFEFVLVVQYQNALNFVRMHDFAGFIDAGTFRNGNQTLAGGHDGRNRQIDTVFKTQVAVGHDTDHFAVFNNRQTGHFAFALCAHFQDFADQCGRRNGNGIFHHAALMALHFGNGTRLQLRRHVFMDNADAAFLSHRNGQTRFGNGIHCSRK